MRLKNPGVLQARPGRRLMVAWSLVVTGAVVALVAWPGAAGQAASPSSWQKSVSLVAYGNPNDIASTYGDSAIDLAASSNANDLTLIINFKQNDTSASDIYSYDAPSDASLIHAINRAQSKGLKVTFKFHLDVPGTWRANISANNRDAWYANYTALVKKYASLGQAHGVSQLVIGTELVSMATFTSNPDNTARWKAIIAQLRAVFSGKLTYSANWGETGFSEEFPHIGFWDDLDYIGISAYFILANDYNPSVSELMANWDTYRKNKIEPFQKQKNKPVIFTEVGYRSVDGAATHPFDYNAGDTYDVQEQSDLINAMISYWKDVPWFAGINYWYWHPHNDCCAPPNRDYVVQGKPSLQTLKDGYANDGPPPPPPVFSISTSSVTPLRDDPGRPFTATTTVKAAAANTGAVPVNVLLQVSRADNPGPMVYEEIKTATFDPGESKSFNLTWTTPPDQPLGSYLFKVQVWKSDWSQTYIKNNNAAVFELADCRVVVNPDDTAGSCGTLRQALAVAAMKPAAERTITFNLPGSGPYQVTLTNPLGPLPVGLKLNGSGNAGCTGPQITLIANDAARGSDLVTNGGNFNNLQLYGFRLKPSGQTRFSCTKVYPTGTPPSALAAAPVYDEATSVKKLQIVAVEQTASFRGSGRFPAQPLAGQHLLAVTIDYPASFLDQVLAADQVYLRSRSTGVLYPTFDIGPGPAGKPQRVTFVFSVPDGTGPLDFQYPQRPALPLPGQ